MKKIVLRDDQMPTRWYNVVPDIPGGLLPPLDPQTHQPISPEKLSAVFPMGLLEQEMSQERFIDIPPEVQEVYSIWRPSPLVRATKLEEALGTRAKIFFKNESVSPVGSHKPNSAVAQAYYNMREGVKRLTTETGAGQWGSALSFATTKFGLECKVFMVRVSYDQKPYRKFIMQAYGGEVVASPSQDTKTGRALLAEFPDTPGSLGMAISEALEDASSRDDTNYALGSVLNHVVLHQTIVGLEAKKQMEIAGAYPDVIIGCCGGGSNFAGLVAPFVPDYLEGKKIEFHGYEPASCPSMTAGMCRHRPISASNVIVPQDIAATLRPERISSPGNSAPRKGSTAIRAGDIFPPWIVNVCVKERGGSVKQTGGISGTPFPMFAFRASVRKTNR